VGRKDALPNSLVCGGYSALYLRCGLDLGLVLDPHTSEQKKDLVQALGLVTVGVAGAVGIFFTWRGQRLTQEGLEDSLRVTREGQITKRFTRAIDQLGATDVERNKLFEIRIGGIYALERIARESEEDYWPIMEILTAYVRQNAPLGEDAAVEESSLDSWSIMEMLRAGARQNAPLGPEEDQEGEEDEAAEKSEEDSEGSTGEAESPEVPTPTLDIQAVMTVIRRRTRYYGHGEPEGLDLHETNLSRADLSKTNLSGADLREADLREANLSGAQLWGADLSKSQLLGTDLREADLEFAYLREVSPIGANLSGANLSGADLGFAYLSNVNLRRANLSGAYLSRVVGLTQEQLEETTGDEYTQLRSDLKPPAHWGGKADEQTEGA
jgi:hypothetical protein